MLALIQCFRSAIISLRSMSAMATYSRVRLCRGYQSERIVKGVPNCGYTKTGCSFGAHRCSKCGRFGHDRSDCQNPQDLGPAWCFENHVIEMAGCRMPPPPVRRSHTDSKHRRQDNPVPPPPPAPWAMACHSKSASPAGPASSASPLPPPPPPPHACASMEPGACGSKGYGKGNYGTEIPGPSLISAPQDVTTGARYVGPTTVPHYRWAEPMPEPVKVTEAIVQEWLLTFKELTPTHSTPLLVGEDVVWRGFKKGKTAIRAPMLNISMGKCMGQSGRKESFIFMLADAQFHQLIKCTPLT